MKIINLKPITIHTEGWLKKRFGDCYAAISTDVSLKLRSAVKDVARVRHNGKVPEYVELLTRKFENAPQGISDHDFVFGYQGSDGWVDGSILTDSALQDYIRTFPEEWEIVQKCLGLTRQKSKHACAYVICNESVKNFIPLTSVGADDTTVTQYTAGSVEAVGGLKMDFLVLNSLRDIGSCIKLIQKRLGVESKHRTIDGELVYAHEQVPFKGEFYSVWNLPELQPVFRDFCEGKTETIFQFNTPSAVGWLKHFNQVKGQKDGEVVKALDSIESLSAFTALDRPGPLDYSVKLADGTSHNMLVEFAVRASGGTRTGSLPILDELLSETHGVIVYQEQLQKVYQMVGKTSAEQADDFRIHISKKQMAKVFDDKKVFMPGAIEVLGNEEVANELWNSMETFGQYGFNKSHSMSYATLAYACAFLKHYYPLEWWCSVLKFADKEEISTKFWSHCGHLIDLPDVKLSGENFEIINERIRAPLSLLLGIGESAHKQIREYGPYSNLRDFVQKVVLHKSKMVETETINPETQEKTVSSKKAYNALHKGAIATLVISGAMDSFFPPDTSIVTMLDSYTEEMMLATGKKRILKADRFDEKYMVTDPLVRFQRRKTALPAYRENLKSLFIAMNVPGLTSENKEFFVGEHVYKLVDYGELNFINNKNPWPPGESATVAAVAYIMEARKFQYSVGRSKEALELIVDMDGGQYKAVKWAGKSKGLPEHLQDPEKLIGSIAVVVYTKYNQDHPFSVEDLTVIRGPLDVNAEKSPT